MHARSGHVPSTLGKKRGAENHGVGEGAAGGTVNTQTQPNMTQAPLKLQCFMAGLFVTPCGRPSPCMPVYSIANTVVFLVSDVQAQVHGYLGSGAPEDRAALARDASLFAKAKRPPCVTLPCLVDCLGRLPGPCGALNTKHLFAAVFLANVEALAKKRPGGEGVSSPLAAAKQFLVDTGAAGEPPATLSPTLVHRWVAAAGWPTFGRPGCPVRLLSPPRTLPTLRVRHGFVLYDDHKTRVVTTLDTGLVYTLHGRPMVQSLDVHFWACSSLGLVAVVETRCVVRGFLDRILPFCAHEEVVGALALQAGVQAATPGSPMHVAPGAPTTLCALRGLQTLVDHLCTHAGPSGLTARTGTLAQATLAVCSNPPPPLHLHFSGVLADLCGHLPPHTRQMVVMHVGLNSRGQDPYHPDPEHPPAAFNDRRAWHRRRVSLLPWHLAQAATKVAQWALPCALCGDPLASHRDLTNPLLTIGPGFDTFRTHADDVPAALCKRDLHKAAACIALPYFHDTAVTGCLADPPVFLPGAFRALATPDPPSLLVHTHCKYAFTLRCARFLHYQ